MPSPLVPAWKVLDRRARAVNVPTNVQLHDLMRDGSIVPLFNSVSLKELDEHFGRVLEEARNA